MPRSAGKWHSSISCIATLLALSLPSAAQSLEVTLDPAKTRIEWTLGDVLHTVQGTFRMKSGTIQFDPQTGDASGQIIVDATSGASGNRMRDSKMNKDVLQSSRYPQITFAPKHVSGFVAGVESQTVQVAGIFSIHGASHDLTLALPVSVKNSTVEGHTKFTVPYEAWGMKNPSTLFLKVSNTVQISISTVGDVRRSAASQASR